MDSRGWWDVAYSFLVDEDGTVYEGRGAGNQGGHTAGDNSRSHAICVMGDYSDRPAPDAAMHAVAALLRHGKDEGWWGELTGGHRDARPYSALNATACPGDGLYDQIRTIRELIIDGPTIPIPEPEPQPSPGGANEVQTPTLRRGATGPQVTAMQALLRYKGGNAALPVDGDFGPLTEQWLKDFQRHYQVTGGPDGIAGMHSWQALVDV